MVCTGFDEKSIGRRNPNSNFLFSQKSSWPDLDRACMIEIRDPANISMLDPIERVALGMVGSSSNSPPLQVQEFQDEEGRPCDHALCLITTKRNIDIEDYVHEYYSLEKFKAAYMGIIEPMPDKRHWPKVDLGFLMGAPLAKRPVGRQRKLRMKSFLETGGTGKKKKPMIRGPMKCKRCDQVGHREASSKCPLNGTKKRHVFY